MANRVLVINRALFSLIFVGCLLSSVTVTAEQARRSLLPAAEALSAQAAAPATGAASHQAVVNRYCVTCHNERLKTAGLLLDEVEVGQVNQDPAVWEKVVRKLRTGLMPPDGRPRPDAETYTSMVSYLETALDQASVANPNPGWPAEVHRLNRAEYTNAIRDLLGLEVNGRDLLPADDSGYGFDNIGDVLSLSPVLFDKYLAAAEGIADEVIDGTPAKGPSDLLTCLPKSDADWLPCARQILVPVARRAFRRPLRDGEMDELLRLVESVHADGATFERGIRLALQAILVSPNFLFHIVEVPVLGQADAIQPLSGFELAERISFFLWSRLPDDELAALAKAGKLTNPAVVEQQVRRMLKDRRASALAENFAAQWLQLRRLETITPDPGYYPAFDEDLRRNSRRETELFFSAVASNDLSVLTLLDADFSFINERLARHYGIPGIEGAHFRRVSFEDGRRGGILGHASILTLTSNPTRTSPVKRGKWILGQVLGMPPKPPPPNAGDLSEETEEVQAASLRERLEKHRADPVCASCHRIMDPIGFALENYDGVGAWRTRDGKFPINAAGTLPDGTFFDGPVDLKKVLLERKRDFVWCLSEKLLTYALGRGIEYFDDCALEDIVKAVEADDYRFSRLVIEVVRSVPFRMKRSQESSP